MALPAMMRRLCLSALLLLALPLTARPAEPVTLDYFGLHIHRADAGTAWPEVPFGSWRLWDAGVGWASLQPERGRWVFERLDRQVAMARARKVALLLPLGMTPRWASARPDEKSAYQPGAAAEPRTMADWETYVATVGRRYRGEIRHFEIWNEPNDRSHYTGSVEMLVALTCSAYRILKGIDPAIQVVSPASASYDTRYLDRFLAAGGKACIDVVAHHFYVPRFGPERMVPLIREVKQIMARHGVARLPLWNTETGWWIANGDGTPDVAWITRGWRRLAREQEAGAVLQRAFLLARAEGVARFYWYAWDNQSMGLIEKSSGASKPMVRDWEQVAGLMLGRKVLGCQPSGAAWQCVLEDARGGRITVGWRDDDALVAREGAGAGGDFPKQGVPRRMQ